MGNISLTRLVLSILISSVALLFTASNFVKHNEDLPFNLGQSLGLKSVNLGLDLKGGSHLLLKVDMDSYINDQLEMLCDNIRKSFREKKLGYKNLKISDGAIMFSARIAEDLSKLKEAVLTLDKGLLVNTENDIVKISYSNTQIANMRAHVLDRSIEIIRMRVDSTGTKEPVIQKQGDMFIILQVAGEDNPSYIKSILGQTAKLSFHMVLDNESKAQDSISIPLAPRENREGESDASSSQYHVLLSKTPILTGDMLTNAQATFSEKSDPAVSFSLNSLGAKLFGDATKTGRGKRMAIVLDGKILSVATINEPILGGNSIISGGFTLETAENLALMLRAGALPAPLQVEEERVIGASLGEDSIQSGQKAGIIGFTGVVIFMIWCYGILGIFANVALFLSMVYILAILSALQATLTLPGIAGIILTIGMAVDANILIYERIREEMIKNVSIGYAVNKGFEAAFSTIADSNITTLISALILYYFGTGAVRGFAVSLSIGIVASMFSAIVITKLLIDLWIYIYKPKSLGI